jgi:hypothetical protein
MRTMIIALAMLTGAPAADCNPPHSFRLYRTSIARPVYVASFNRPGERPDFNKGNCEMVAEMLAAKAGVSAWWCEPAEGRS